MLSDQLRSSPLFESLTDTQRERIAERFKEVDVDLGAVLARKGDFADHLFVVVAGTAAVTVDDDLVTMLRPGNTFGEIGVVEDSRRTANVVAVTPMSLLTMSADDYNELVEEFPDFGARAKVLAQARLARTEG